MTQKELVEYFSLLSLYDELYGLNDEELHEKMLQILKFKFQSEERFKQELFKHMNIKKEKFIKEYMSK